MKKVVIPVYKCRVCGKLHEHVRVGAGEPVKEGDINLDSVALSALTLQEDYAPYMTGPLLHVEVCDGHVGVSDLAGFVIKQVE